MSDNIRKNQSEKRREHNRDLIRRMRNGESLKTIDSRASWFPPRPMIQKDQDAISRLYQTEKVMPTLDQERLGDSLSSAKAVRLRGRGMDEAG